MSMEELSREQRLEIAAKMVLLFHSLGHWDSDTHNEWNNSVVKLNPDRWRLRPADSKWQPEATTKMLCDCVRKALE